MVDVSTATFLASTSTYNLLFFIYFYCFFYSYNYYVSTVLVITVYNKNRIVVYNDVLCEVIHHVFKYL